MSTCPATHFCEQCGDCLDCDVPHYCHLYPEGQMIEHIDAAWKLARPQLEDRTRVARDALKQTGGEAARLGGEIGKAIAECTRLVASGELAHDVASEEMTRHFDALGEVARGCREATAREAISTAKEWLEIAAKVGIMVARVAAGV